MMIQNPVRCLIFSAIPKNFKIFSTCQKTLVGRKNLIWVKFIPFLLQLCTFLAYSFKARIEFFDQSKIKKIFATVLFCLALSSQWEFFSSHRKISISLTVGIGKTNVSFLVIYCVNALVSPTKTLNLSNKNYFC